MELAPAQLLLVGVGRDILEDGVVGARAAIVAAQRVLRLVLDLGKARPGTHVSYSVKRLRTGCVIAAKNRFRISRVHRQSGILDSDNQESRNGRFDSTNPMEERDVPLGTQR